MSYRNSYQKGVIYFQRHKTFYTTKNYITEVDYGIDNERLIDFMTNSEAWFPTKFGCIDTQCRDAAFDLMIKFNVIDIYTCRYLSESYVEWLLKSGNALLETNELFI